MDIKIMTTYAGNLQVFKLSTKETVVGEIQQETEQGFFIAFPLVINFGQKGTYFEPWMYGAEYQVCHVDMNDVIIMYEPSEALIEAYVRCLLKEAPKTQESENVKSRLSGF